MIEVSSFDLVLAIGLVIALVLTVVAIYRKEGDSAASVKLREFQADPETITTLEAGVQEYIPEGMIVRFQDGAEFLRLVAKFTVIESDDIAVGIIEDILEVDEQEPSS